MFCSHYILNAHVFGWYMANANYMIPWKMCELSYDFPPPDTHLCLAIIHECAPIHYVYLINRVESNVRTTEKARYNGHMDDQNIKEEEVYHDLCVIQRASRPQVFLITFFVCLIPSLALYLMLYRSQSIHLKQCNAIIHIHLVLWLNTHCRFQQQNIPFSSEKNKCFNQKQIQKFINKLEQILQFDF